MNSEFYSIAYTFDLSVWDLSESQRLAALGVDQRIHRNKQHYLEADIRRLWINWFIEGVIDPYIFLEKNQNPILIDVIREVELHLSKTFNNPINILWKETKESISKVILKRILQIRDETTRRRSFTKADKEILLTKSAPHPRCWICGEKFTKEAIDIFTGNSGIKINTPTYIDIFRPKGLKPKHLEIQIDHVYPVSKGGHHDITNFRLSCGWCNLYKRDYTSLYEAPGKPIRLIKGKITTTTQHRTIPQFFWTVRALGLTQRCEHENCTATTQNEHLLLSLIEPTGAATPSNLKIVCKNHDDTKGRYHLSQDVLAAIPKRK